MLIVRGAQFTFWLIWGPHRMGAANNDNHKTGRRNNAEK